MKHLTFVMAIGALSACARAPSRPIDPVATQCEYEAEIAIQSIANPLYAGYRKAELMGMCIRARQNAVVAPSIPGAPSDGKSLASLVVYDAPSVNANQVFTILPGTPFEVISEVGNWRKVRNLEGRLGWVAK